MQEVLISGEPGVGKTLLLLKLMKEFENVIWITTTRTAKTLRKILKNDNVWIIDAYAGTNISVHPKNLIVSNPFDLNRMSIEISEILNQIEGEKLLILDSITGLLLYHNLQKIVHFISILLAKIREVTPSVFTLTKNAHDIYIEITFYTMFPTVIELLRGSNNETKRIVRVVRALEDIEPNFGEAKIVRNDIILPDHIMDYIIRALKF